MKAIAPEIRDERVRSAELQEAPVQAHQALCGIECFHRHMQEFACMIKANLEAKLGAQLGTELGLVRWLIWHSSLLTHCLHVPHGTGSTAFAAARRHNYDGALVEFGEAVQGRIPQEQSDLHRTSKRRSGWR